MRWLRSQMLIIPRHTYLKAWFVPMLYAGGALLVSFTVPRLADNLLAGFVSTVSVNAAIGFYSAIASGMMALMAIVFSLNFAMMQFSATAYSPRLVLWISRDPVISHAIGVFTATFLYALAAVAWVDRGGSGRVPLSGVLVVGLPAGIGAFPAGEKLSRLLAHPFLNVAQGSCERG